MSACVFQEGQNGTGLKTPDLTDDRKNGGSLEMGKQTGWMDGIGRAPRSWSPSSVLFSVCMCKCMYVCVSMCVSCTHKVEDTQVHTQTNRSDRH